MDRFKVFCSTVALLLVISFSFGQIYDPIEWSVSVESTGDNSYNIVMEAALEEGWHLYSQNLPSDDGPIATEFTFEEEGYTLDGSVEEEEFTTEYDPNFEMDLNYFEGTVKFTQKVKEVNTDKISGSVYFMVCNAERCLPPTEHQFEINFSGETDADDSESQIFEPIKWNFSSERISDTEYEIKMSATIDKGWHLYAQVLPSDEGPIATEFLYNDSVGYTLIGKTEEPEFITHFDPNFEMDLNYFEDQVDFTQKIKLDNTDLMGMTGSVYFMVCNDERCLPPEEKFFTIDFATGQEVVEIITVSDENAGRFKIESVDLSNPLTVCGEVEVQEEEEKKGLWTIFILGFLGGLIALLTPCVFPMIPLTVSFFTKSSEDRKKGIFNAIFYGLFILLIYVLLSLPFHFLDSVDPEILNNISTNVILNIVFFAIFLFFAFSFFGYYEITLPSGLANKMDANASRYTGLIGIFFMALTLAIVSFSCTGPILGSLLAGSLSKDGGAIQLTAGMGGFGLALALPFALFAAFPAWLNSLPKSGGWLNVVKVVLGFIELALALKFLSNADLVKDWGILKYEVFMGLWTIIAILLAIYLFGKMKFPHDSPIKKLGITRIVIAVTCIAFAVYLCTGFRYSEKTKTFTSLSLLSGLAPPAGYSWVYPSECPLSLPCFKDYDEGLAYAKSVNKPIMIDFTGKACVNCRKVEENIWVDEEVYNRLSDDYVLISLYVDYRKELSEEEQITYLTSYGKQKKIKTIGDKWATFQTETFENNSQPYYVLLTPDEKLIADPIGYTNDLTIQKYRNFLNCGLEAFKTQGE